ncbi:MAG TPA: hypothetical protein VGL04_09825 [Sporichthyaceae bacterium]
MDEHTIALLREVGDSGREATGADIAAAMHAGRKIRRRRRALQVVGSGGVVGIAVAILAVAGANGGVHHDTVVAADSGPAPASDTKPAAIKPKPTLTPADLKEMAARADMRHANNMLMLDVLGKDWAATDDSEPFGAELVRGTDSGQNLPDEFAVNAGIEVLGGEGSSFTVAAMCAPTVEKGIHTGSCTPVDTGNGTVYLQRWTSTPGEWKPAGGRADVGYGTGTTVYLERVDHSLVRVQMLARGADGKGTAAGQKTGTAWLGKYDQTLEKLAADPRVQPHAESARAASIVVSDHDRDQAILQKALGGGFTVGGGGPVDLEPGSQKAAELPSDYYGASAELTAISSAAFHAACEAKAGLAACEAKTLDDGTVVHLRSWADRDASSSTMRGESAVYLERKDGSVLLASLEVTGTNVTAAKAADHAKVVRQWMDALQSALLTAITDPDVVGTPAAN